MFAEDDLTCDHFLNGRLQILQPRQGYRAAMDPVFLAAAVPARPGQTVLELGCGVGVASLCLGARVPDLGLVGLELQPDYASLARRNAEAAGMTLEVVEGDLSSPPPELRARSFDHVMANPPYYPPGGGTPASDRGRERSLREETPLAQWVQTAIRRLRSGGWMTFIQSADRLPDLMAGLDRRMGDIRVLPLAPRIGREARRVIVQARKGGRGPFRLLAPFIVHDGPVHLRDAEDLTDAARAVVRDGAALPLAAQ
ncbi:tRNA1(Val) A37 N6-methylase TrmN6 [Albidovulum inexpectatum]|uniref:tRNA1(Val) A37 N6-methylase TrmN6 n=1 Tax=Albidovulum inexpectatum TaxID=196587 RepID=A0A2S5JGV1_9RHOB|nr:methyltransferase [Albidovulum inexpectatum]PPB80525.1 tRNA1(Val) A37 N6-methylase TrmN6 [Albidovulum inexpectatum]